MWIKMWCCHKLPGRLYTAQLGHCQPHKLWKRLLGSHCRVPEPQLTIAHARFWGRSACSYKPRSALISICDKQWPANPTIAADACCTWWEVQLHWHQLQEDSEFYPSRYWLQHQVIPVKSDIAVPYQVKTAFWLASLTWCTLPWFQATYQASLRFCPQATLGIKHCILQEPATRMRGWQQLVHETSYCYLPY